MHIKQVFKIKILIVLCSFSLLTGCSTLPHTIEINKNFDANAGSQQTIIVGSTATLNATQSTTSLAQNAIYTWTSATSNPAEVVLSDIHSVTPTFVVPLVTGNYVFKLRLGNQNIFSESSVTISVIESILTANAGLNQVIFDQATCTLDGSKSNDSNQLTLNYTWIQDPANPATVALSDEHAVQPTFPNPKINGNYRFWLYVNNQVVTKNSYIDIAISRSPIYVKITPSQTTYYPGQTVSFNVDYSFENGISIPVSQNWTQATNNPALVVFNDPTSKNVSFTVTASGTYSFSLNTITQLQTQKFDISISVKTLSWQQIASNAEWSKRAGHTSVVFNNKLWVIGGYDGNDKNDVWYSENGKTWIQTTESAPWSARHSHSSVVFDNKIWVISGIDSNSNYKNDVWYSEDGKNWAQVTSSIPWSARYGHTTVVFNNKLWITGGYDNNYRRKNDIWYSEDSKNWSQITSTIPWATRSGHSSIVFDNKIWIIGGNVYGYTNGVWYSEDGKNWTEVTSSISWPERGNHTSVVFDNKLWIIGGYDGNRKKDVWSSVDGITWFQVATISPWSPRNNHTSVVFNNKLWVIGGYDDDHKNDVWSLSLE